MRTRIFALLPLLAASLLFGQSQYAQITSTNIGDAAGNKLASGTITFTPVNNAGTPIAPQAVSGGRVVPRPVVFKVINGVITPSFGTAQLVDVTQASPLNFCYTDTIHDNIGGNTWSPDPCIQPAYNASWCSVTGGATTCNFDLYAPTSTPGVTVQAPSLIAGIFTTGAAGSAVSCTVNIAGSAPNYALSCSVPQGIQGVKGDPGVVTCSVGTCGTNGDYTVAGKISAGTVAAPIVLPGNIPQFVNRLQSSSTITIAVDGDSRCDVSAFVARGDGTAAQAPWSLVVSDPASSFYQRGTYVNQCVGGTTTQQMQARFATNWGSRCPNTTGTPGYFFTNGGVNNFVVGHETGIQAFTNLRSYWNTIQACGFNLVAMTVYDHDFATQANLDILNANIRQAKRYVNSGYTAGTATYTTTGAGTGGTLTIGAVSGSGAITSVSMSGATGFAVNDIIYPARTGIANALLQVSAVSSGNPTAFTITTPPFVVLDEQRGLNPHMYSPSWSNDALHINAAGAVKEAQYISSAFWDMAGPTGDTGNLYSLPPTATAPTYNYVCPGGSPDSLGLVSTGTNDTICGTNSSGKSITTGSFITMNGSTLGGMINTGSYHTLTGWYLTNSLSDGNNHTVYGAHLDYNSLHSNDIIAIGVSNSANATGSTNIAICDSCMNGSGSTVNTEIVLGQGSDPSGTGPSLVIVGHGSALNFTTDSNSACGGNSTCNGLAGGSGGIAAWGQGAGSYTGGGTIAVTTSGAWGYNARFGAAGTNVYQIGTGTNSTSNSLQFLNYEIADSTGQLYNKGIALAVPLIGTTGSIGGSALTVGQCTSGTATVTGVGSYNVSATATPTTYPGDGFYWYPYVSAAATMTVKVCAFVAGTPTATTYNVRVLQ